jgi:DNA helicase-2/ATP-dependent DNA helicase PcrA
LSAERSSVRQEARRNLYTGKTYNSLENVSEFFKQRGVNVPVRGFGGPNATPPATPPAPAKVAPPRPPAAPIARPPVTESRQGGLFGEAPPWEEASIQRKNQPIPPPKPRVVLPSAPPPPKRPSSTGTVVEHPKYGRGTVVRREGDGADAKVVVIFERHGLKKLVEKYAGLTNAR